MDQAERRALIAEARFGRKQSVSGSSAMAITSHPLATRAAIDVLRSGGNACDAALCASVTQTVVEPHMTTITGVLSQLYYDAATKTTTYMNGSLNAPKAKLEGFTQKDLSRGRGVAVPGFWAGFEAALERHGSKSKKELVAPAIELGREGFEIHPFLYGEMFVMSHSIGRSEEGRSIYMPEGSLLSVGDMLRQLKAAETLECLVDSGSDYFYRGEFAKKFCKVVEEAGGVITMEDLESYEVRWQAPARGSYRGYDIVASTPPDNGGTHLIEAFNMIELLDLQKLGHPTESEESLYQLMSISELVKTEGAKQNDPASHPLPLDTILSKEYARMRFELMQMSSPMESVRAAAVPGSNHVTVMDQNGNVSSILHSCMALPWNNGLFCEGVSICAGGGHFLRTMPKPGFRASCYVAPNIFFADGRPVLASGSPSVGLIANIIQNTVNLLDFGLPIEESVHKPRFGNSYLAGQQIEADIDEKLRKAVTERGVDVEVVSPWHWNCGSFEGIYVGEGTGTLSACGDPRRCSSAQGF